MIDNKWDMLKCGIRNGKCKNHGNHCPYQVVLVFYFLTCLKLSVNKLALFEN
jgi:hypothetical protein